MSTSILAGNQDYKHVPVQPPCYTCCVGVGFVAAGFSPETVLCFSFKIPFGSENTKRYNNSTIPIVFSRRIATNQILSPRRAAFHSANAFHMSDHIATRTKNPQSPCPIPANPKGPIIDELDENEFHIKNYY